ncbi:MAG: DUF2231 domain-containing protein [Chloroflexota bacterium]
MSGLLRKAEEYPRRARRVRSTRPYPARGPIVTTPQAEAGLGIPPGAVSSLERQLLLRDRFWTRAARWLLGAGVATGGIAAVPGLIDYTSIRRARQPIGIAHAVGNATILGMAATSLRIRLRRRGDPVAAALFLSGAAAAGLTVTGWLGGELTFRHRVGVARSLPHRTEAPPRSQSDLG